MTGLPAAHPLSTGLTSGSALVQAYRGQRPDRLPIWMMRQAGRSLPEYRAAREGTAMLDACLTPELAAEITCQPVRRHRVDAAIFFSDIVVPVRLAGVGVEIVPGVGPVVDHPVRTAADVAALPELDPDALAPIRDAVALSVAALGPTPLIGFAGAPFTVASYLVEGRPSRDHAVTRALMASDPQTWHALLAWVARTAGAFLRAQAAVADLGVPRVHFGTGSRHLLAAMRDAGADVVGVDAQTPLDEAVALLGGAAPVQGNIDPALLDAPWTVMEEHARDVVRRGWTAPGHVVNLGHGVPPGTDPDVLTRLVELVHALPATAAAAMPAAAAAPTEGA